MTGIREQRTVTATNCSHVAFQLSSDLHCDENCLKYKENVCACEEHCLFHDAFGFYYIVMFLQVY